MSRYVHQVGEMDLKIYFKLIFPILFSQCETMSENVCIDVTETKCEVVPYKECKVYIIITLHDHT